MQTRNIGPPSFLTESNTNILLSPSERTGRKSYKLSNRKGGEKKEAVWPPHLEAALLDGLQHPLSLFRCLTFARAEKIPTDLEKWATTPTLHQTQRLDIQAYSGYHWEIQNGEAGWKSPPANNREYEGL